MKITDKLEKQLEFAIRYEQPLVFFEHHWKEINTKGYYRVQPSEHETSCVARWRITLKPQGGAYAD